MTKKEHRWFWKRIDADNVGVYDPDFVEPLKIVATEQEAKEIVDISNDMIDIFNLGRVEGASND